MFLLPFSSLSSLFQLYCLFVNIQLHSDLYHMVLDGASEKAQQRVKASNFLFIDCVYQLLNATKIITYS